MNDRPATCAFDHSYLVDMMFWRDIRRVLLRDLDLEIDELQELHRVKEPFCVCDARERGDWLSLLGIVFRIFDVATNQFENII